MNILEILSVKIPRTPFGQFYEVPLKDILLSNQMLEQGCPVQDETEYPPLFQTRLVSRDVLSEFVKAWSRLEDGVRMGNGELVVRDNREVECPRSGRTPQREQKVSPRNGTAEIMSCENVRLDISVDARDRGLDETLSETFPCSDALSSIPYPPVEGVVWQ